jgi:hypothetical protein
MPFLRTVFTTAFLATAFLAGGLAAAQAQATPSPHQIQAQIAAGQNATALSELQTVLQAHPDSGIAWYLSAEAQDASGNEDAARAALAKAQQYAPGLPFANQNDVAALQAHLAAPAARSGFGVSPMLIIGALVLLFIVFRLFSRARRAVPVYQDGFAPGYGNRPQYPYGQGGGQGGGMPYGPGGAPGGGLGSALLGGLAAGAGIAAGERIIDDMTGGNRNDGGFGLGGNGLGGDGLGGNFDPSPVPDRDDGLQGSPGWDAGGSGSDNSGGSDSSDSW